MFSWNGVGVEVAVGVKEEVGVKEAVGVAVATTTVMVAPDKGNGLKLTAWPLVPDAPVRLKE